MVGFVTQLISLSFQKLVVVFNLETIHIYNQKICHNIDTYSKRNTSVTHKTVGKLTGCWKIIYSLN